METSLIVGSLISSLAGLTVALVTAMLTEHREQRRWLQTKVHQPLYGELTNVISGELPGEDGDYTSLWADLEYYKAYRVDPDLAEALDRYASDISELAGYEREADFTAFVDELPAAVCERDEAVATLPSGRTIDMRTWLKRNALVLATDPTIRSSVGCDPASLAFLWREVDGLSTADIEDDEVDTAAILERVSVEFNWGYEGFYEQWPDDWADVLVGAFRTTADRPDSTLAEMLSLRRDVGAAASEIKSLIEVRSERGLFGSLWHDWFRG